MDAIGVLHTNPLDDYQLLHRIGSGTYGDVFKVGYRLTSSLTDKMKKEKKTLFEAWLLVVYRWWGWLGLRLLIVSRRRDSN